MVLRRNGRAALNMSMIRWAKSKLSQTFTSKFEIFSPSASNKILVAVGAEALSHKGAETHRLLPGDI